MPLSLSCTPFAGMMHLLFHPVAIEMQGKAQARSVQVTSEPSAVVPVEQKQVTKGTPRVKCWPRQSFQDFVASHRAT